MPLDGAVAVEPVGTDLVAGLVFPTFPGIGFASNAVQGDGERFVRLGRKRAETHAGRGKATTNILDGLDLLERFELDPRGLPFDLHVDLDARGWLLHVKQRGRTLERLSGRWTSSRRAPIRAELSGDTFLWGHLGNWSDGRGEGSLKTVLRPD